MAIDSRSVRACRRFSSLSEAISGSSLTQSRFPVRNSPISHPLRPFIRRASTLIQAVNYCRRWEASGIENGATSWIRTASEGISTPNSCPAGSARVSRSGRLLTHLCKADRGCCIRLRWRNSLMLWRRELDLPLIQDGSNFCHAPASCLSFSNLKHSFDLCCHFSCLSAARRNCLYSAPSR